MCDLLCDVVVVGLWCVDHNLAAWSLRVVSCSHVGHAVRTELAQYVFGYVACGVCVWLGCMEDTAIVWSIERVARCSSVTLCVGWVCLVWG